MNKIIFNLLQIFLKYQTNKQSILVLDGHVLLISQQNLHSVHLQSTIISLLEVFSWFHLVLPNIRQTHFVENLLCNIFMNVKSFCYKKTWLPHFVVNNSVLCIYYCSVSVHYLKSHLIYPVKPLKSSFSKGLGVCWSLVHVVCLVSTSGLISMCVCIKVIYITYLRYIT